MYPQALLRSPPISLLGSLDLAMLLKQATPSLREDRGGAKIRNQKDFDRGTPTPRAANSRAPYIWVWAGHRPRKDVSVTISGPCVPKHNVVRASVTARHQLAKPIRFQSAFTPHG